MKVKIQQFLFGKNHSWSVVGKEIGRELIHRGHEVHFISTDGINKEFIDSDLAKYIKYYPDNNYDINYSYTAPKNFINYLNGNKGIRLGCWNYEWPYMPRTFVQAIASKNNVDKFLPSSKWFYDICLQNKIPEEKLCLMPHGIDVDKFINAVPMQLKTDKKIKILINVTQLHIRKNLPGTLKAIGEALNKNDDVCLVLKVSDTKPKMAFELSFSQVFNEFNKKYPNHVECLILKEYIPNIECLYKACDILFLLSHAEAYSLTHAEGLISGQVVFSSNYGGALDFLNDNNSFLIPGKMVRAPTLSQYWEPNVLNGHFEPDVKIAAEKLRYCIDNFETVKKEKLSFVTKNDIDNFRWGKQVDILEGLVK